MFDIAIDLLRYAPMLPLPIATRELLVRETAVRVFVAMCSSSGEPDISHTALGVHCRSWGHIQAF